MWSRKIVCSSLLLVSFLHTALSHVVWKHPSPRYDRDDRSKAHPCGTGGQLNDWTAPPTTLTPGKQLLEFRETIAHRGAPCRIALTVGSDSHYSDYVLLDHIPHNDGAARVNGEILHAVEVEIPDVDCSAQNCGLQLIQVMTDKFSGGQTCANPSGLSNSCGSPSFAYFSCANIKIDGGSVADPEPIYRSWTGGSAGSREPYAKGEVGAWCYDTEKQHWRLHGNGYSCPGMDPVVEDGAGDAESCARGYGFDAATQACEPCGSGRECTLDACTACSECKTGFFKAGQGPEACEPCPASTYGTVTGGAGEDSCLPCPARSSTGGQVGRARREECVCEQGFEAEQGVDDWECVAVEQGTEEGGGGDADTAQESAAGQEENGGEETGETGETGEGAGEGGKEGEGEGEGEFSADVTLVLRFALSEGAAEAQRSEIREAVAAALGVSAAHVRLAPFAQDEGAAGATGGSVMPAVTVEVSVAVADEAAGRELAAAASQASVDAAMRAVGIEGTMLVSEPAVVQREAEEAGGGDQSAGSGPRGGGPSGEQAASLLLTAAMSILVLNVV